MLLWAVKDKYFSFIGYFSKNILIFFSFLYRSIELLYKKEVKFVEKKIKGLVLFFFVQDLLVILYVWYGQNLQSLHIV